MLRRGAGVRWLLRRHDGLHGDGETEALQHLGNLLLWDAMLGPPGDKRQGCGFVVEK